MTELQFSPRAWFKLNYLMMKGQTEVGGMGILTPDKNKLVVDDFVLIPQEATAASVEFDDDGWEDFVEEHAAKGLPADRYMRVWIHTHPGNSATPSSTDQKSWEATFGDFSWALMFIIARGGNTSCELRVKNDFITLTYQMKDSIDWSRPCPVEGDREKWDAEYDRCVREPVAVVHHHNSHFNTGGYVPLDQQRKELQASNYKQVWDSKLGMYIWVPDVRKEDKKTEIGFLDDEDLEWKEHIAKHYDHETLQWHKSKHGCVAMCKVFTLDDYELAEQTEWDLIFWWAKSRNFDLDKTPRPELWKAFHNTFGGRKQKQQKAAK